MKFEKLFFKIDESQNIISYIDEYTKYNFLCTYYTKKCGT